MFITNFQEEALLERSYPELIPLENLQKAHPLVENLFLKVKIPKVPVAGRVKHFDRMWEKFDKGSANFENCEKIHNPNFIKTLVKVCSN